MATEKPKARGIYVGHDDGETTIYMLNPTFDRDFPATSVGVDVPLEDGSALFLSSVVVTGVIKAWAERSD